jgi:hypothetical protein
MKYIYEEIVKESPTGITKVIKRTDEDGNEAWIPIYPGNSDYETYLEHEATPK